MADQKNSNDNVIFIGIKPFMNYVTSVVIQFTSKNQDEVIIKARGKYIQRAVDVAEVIRKKFLKENGVEIKKVEIDSEEVENKEGRKISVSTIEIILAKIKK